MRLQAVARRARNDIGVDLKTIPLFEGVPEELLQLISVETVRHYVHEDVIFHQGDEANSLVLLIQGQAEIKADDTYLVSRGTYEVIGEQAFIGEEARSATAIARGMVKVLELPRDLVMQLMQNPTFCLNLLRMVSGKLAEATAERARRYRNEELLFTEFRAHLSPEIIERLLATGRSYGEPRYINAIILFSDIRGFTQQSSDMPPEEIADQLSPYLDAIVEVIHAHEGLVDKFIGDAVMAIWGFAPSDDDLAAQAFACAQEMVKVASQHTSVLKKG